MLLALIPNYTPNKILISHFRSQNTLKISSFGPKFFLIIPTEYEVANVERLLYRTRQGTGVLYVINFWRVWNCLKKCNEKGKYNKVSLLRISGHFSVIRNETADGLCRRFVSPFTGLESFCGISKPTFKYELQHEEAREMDSGISLSFDTRRFYLDTSSDPRWATISLES